MSLTFTVPCVMWLPPVIQICATPSQPVLPYAALHTSTRPELGAHVAPFVLPVTTVVFKTSELLQSADADVRYVVQALRVFPSAPPRMASQIGA